MEREKGENSVNDKREVKVTEKAVFEQTTGHAAQGQTMGSMLH